MLKATNGRSLGGVAYIYIYISISMLVSIQTPLDPTVPQRLQNPCAYLRLAGHGFVRLIKP